MTSAEPTTAPPELVLAIVAVFAVVFPVFWVIVTFMLSFLSGWQRLGQLYPAQTPTQGERMIWQSARLSRVNLSGVLNLVANETGLGLSMMMLFRAGSRPLFIPWSDVSATHKKRLFRKVVVLRFAKASNIPLEIRPGLANKLAAASAGAFTVASES